MTEKETLRFENRVRPYIVLELGYLSGIVYRSEHAVRDENNPTAFFRCLGDGEKKGEKDQDDLKDERENLVRQITKNLLNLADVLEKHKAVDIKPYFPDTDENKLAKEVARNQRIKYAEEYFLDKTLEDVDVKAPSSAFSHVGLGKIRFAIETDIDAVLEELKTLRASVKEKRTFIWYVDAPTISDEALLSYPERINRTQEALAPLLPSLFYHQGYLEDAPEGIGAQVAWAEYEARGQGVTVCVIERNWFRAHPDLPNVELYGDLLPEVRDEVLPNTRDARLRIPVNGSINHGTRVLGVLAGKPGAKGVTGICHEAKFQVQSYVQRIEREKGEAIFEYVPARAIMEAAERLEPGDILLVETQTTLTPHGNDLPVRYLPEVFSAIRTATEKGIIVVEAAGNGHWNFDSREFEDTYLSSLGQKVESNDLGSIVVGAGEAPVSYQEISDTIVKRYRTQIAPRSVSESNYGRLINLQGWGNHVTTLAFVQGQGWRYNTQWGYTLNFGGTSSAAAIVAGAAACVQSFAKQFGEPLGPIELRSLLIDSGTPEASGTANPRIGPQPNIVRAIERFVKVRGITSGPSISTHQSQVRRQARNRFTRVRIV